MNEFLKELRTYFDDVIRPYRIEEEKKKVDISKYKFISNPPATILFVDSKKYVAKAHNEEYDPEKGALVCLMKSFGISHLDLKRMLKGAKIQKKPEPKTVVIETEGNPEYYKEEPKRTYEMAYKEAKSPVGRHKGKPYVFYFDNVVVIRDCSTYFYQKREDVEPMLNKELMVIDVMRDDTRQYYVVEFNGNNYLFAGCELEPVWEE